MIIHTDDVDGYTTSHQFGLDIANLFDKEWGIRMCDPSQMLGVRRDRWTDDDGVEHLKLSMPSYVDDLVDTHARSSFSSSTHIARPYRHDAVGVGVIT